MKLLTTRSDPANIDAAYMVCIAGSMQRSGVHPSGGLSVCPVDSSRLSIRICRRRQSAALPQPGRRRHNAAASGQRRCCDPRRIDADLLQLT